MIPLQMGEKSSLWKELLYKLIKNGKIEKAIILDANERCLCHSAGFQLAEKDFRQLKCAMSDRYSKLMAMNVCGDRYTCFRQGQEADILVGRCGDKILVVHKTSEFFIVAASHSDTPGSSIYEVSKFCTKLTKLQTDKKILTPAIRGVTDVTLKTG